MLFPEDPLLASPVRLLSGPQLKPMCVFLTSCVENLEWTLKMDSVTTSHRWENCRPSIIWQSSPYKLATNPNQSPSGLFHHNARSHTLARTDWALATWDGEGFGERKVLTMNVLVTSVKPTLLELIKWWAVLSGLALSEKMSCSVQA